MIKFKGTNETDLVYKIDGDVWTLHEKGSAEWDEFQEWMKAGNFPDGYKSEEMHHLDAIQYITDRVAAYPSIVEYLDGVVKGDQAQIDKYIADCLAVKTKFPKP